VKHNSDAIKFGVLGLLWGGSFLLIKYGLMGFSSAQVGLIRLGVGAITLSLVARIMRRPWSHTRRQHVSLFIVSVFMFVLPVSLYSWAGQYIPSAVSAILNATTPIMTVIVASIALRESRPTPRQVLGVLVGALGIVFVFEPWSISLELDGSQTLVAMLACLGATSCYAIAYVLMSRLLSARAQQAHQASPIDAVASTAEQLIWASLVCIVISPLTAVWTSPVQWRTDAVIAMAILGVFSTGYGYFLNTQLTESMGSVRTAQVTYVTPIVGVLLGWALLHEALNLGQLAGGIVVLAGIWITRSHNPAKKATASR